MRKIYDVRNDFLLKYMTGFVSDVTDLLEIFKLKTHFASWNIVGMYYTYHTLQTFQARTELQHRCSQTEARDILLDCSI
jgi:hypothetical protein